MSAVLVSLALGGSASAAEWVTFPPGFKWCVATSAHQTEGYNTESDWWDWEHLSPCKIKGCAASGAADDHWNRLDNDINLLRDLNVRQYRFSIEWAKIEPRQGTWDWAAVEHYRHEVQALQAAGIEPLITLHHFSLPRWFAALGGWAWQDAPSAFERYTEFVYTAIAPGVRDWVTINEPLVYLGGAYSLGIFPPGVPAGNTRTNVPVPSAANLLRVLAPLRGVLLSHVASYRALHRLAAQKGTAVRVGMANHLRIFDPQKPFNFLDWIVAGIMDRVWNWALPTALATGRFELYVPFMIHESVTVPGLAGTQDFFGLNYYSRDMVAFKWLGGVSVSLEVKAGAPVNDMGWEIYPEGIYRLAMGIRDKFPGLPILITENGTSDHEDRFRTAFLKDHLAALSRAISDGAPVENYCHWSLMDNFEWAEGFGPRFGLYEVDYATEQRIPRPSARFFSDVAAHNGFEY